MKTVEIQVTLTDTQAWEFAQFLKRVCFSEYRNNATSDEEAYHMRDAGEQIRRALAEIDPNLTIFYFSSYDSQVARNFNQDRLVA